MNTYPKKHFQNDFNPIRTPRFSMKTLHDFKLNSSLCSSCKIDDEISRHLFFDCTKTKLVEPTEGIYCQQNTSHSLAYTTEYLSGF